MVEEHIDKAINDGAGADIEQAVRGFPTALGTAVARRDAAMEMFLRDRGATLYVGPKASK